MKKKIDIEFPYVDRGILSYLEDSGYFGKPNWRRNLLLLYRVGSYIAGDVYKNGVDSLFDSSYLSVAIKAEFPDLDLDHFQSRFLGLQDSALWSYGTTRKEFRRKSAKFFKAIYSPEISRRFSDDFLYRNDTTLLDLLSWSIHIWTREAPEQRELIASETFYLYLQASSIFDIFDLSIHRYEELAQELVLRSLFGETDLVGFYLNRGIHTLADTSELVWQARFPLLLGNLYKNLKLLVNLAYMPDIPHVTYRFFEEMRRNYPQSLEIFLARSDWPGHSRETLEVLGKRREITRERIRQIEKKAGLDISRLVSYLNEFMQCLFDIITSDLKTKGCTAERLVAEVERICKPGPDLPSSWKDYFILLLQPDLESSLRYDAKTGLVVPSDYTDIKAHLEEMTKDLPETLSIDYVQGLSPSIRSLIEHSYRILDGAYVRNGIRLSDILSRILKEDFSEGYHAQQLKENDDYRRLLQILLERYHMSSDSWSPRSITAILSRANSVGIERGIYISRDRVSVDPSRLIQDVQDYLRTGPKAIYYRTLYEIFKDRWNEVGVHSFYLMKNIVDKNLPAGWKSKRDYVYTDSVHPHNLIREACESFGREFSLSDLRNLFPGIEDYTFLQLIYTWEPRGCVIATGDNHFLMAKDLIGWSGEVSDALKKLIDRELETSSDGRIDSGTLFLYLHTSELVWIMHSLPQIDNRFKLFSLLHAKFGDLYRFRRPFIIKKSN